MPHPTGHTYASYTANGGDGDNLWKEHEAFWKANIPMGDREIVEVKNILEPILEALSDDIWIVVHDGCIDILQHDAMPLEGEKYSRIKVLVSYDFHDCQTYIDYLGGRKASVQMMVEFILTLLKK